VLDDRELARVQERPNLLGCEPEQPQSRNAALVQALAADGESRCLHVPPLVAHLLGDEIPELVLAPVEQPVMNRKGRREAQSKDAALNSGRQLALSTESGHELLYLLGIADDAVGNPTVATIAESLQAPATSLLPESGCDALGIVQHDRLAPARNRIAYLGGIVEAGAMSLLGRPRLGDEHTLSCFEPIGRADAHDHDVEIGLARRVAASVATGENHGARLTINQPRDKPAREFDGRAGHTRNLAREPGSGRRVPLPQKTTLIAPDRSQRKPAPPPLSVWLNGRAGLAELPLPALRAEDVQLTDAV